MESSQTEEHQTIAACFSILDLTLSVRNLDHRDFKKKKVDRRWIMTDEHTITTSKKMCDQYTFLSRRLSSSFFFTSAALSKPVMYFGCK